MRRERGYGARVRRLLERNASAFMVAQRDGDGHVLIVQFHEHFLMGVDEMPLRQAIMTMNPHVRKVWLAVEVGYYIDADVIDGVPHRVERFVEPMSVEQCQEWYGYTHATVETYLSAAHRHLKSRLSSGPRDGAAALLHKVRTVR
jgi:hypothetical protein